MDKDLKRSIILENYQNSNNRKRKDDDSNYKKINSRNISCIDNIDLYIKINNNVIEDITIFSSFSNREPALSSRLLVS